MMNRLLLFIFICSFLSACNSTRNETHNNLSEDSVPHKGLTKSPQQSINETSFANKPESIDTVHDGWHLTMEEFYDGTVCKDKYDNGNTQYAVYALRINITKDGKRIIKDKVITPKSHSGKTDGTEFMFNNLPDVFFSPTTCYLEMYVCEPETDNCLGKILAFSPSCSVSEYYLTDCMGEEIDSSTSAISCFFAIYMHEISLPYPSQTVIDSLLRAYCAPALSEKLSHRRLTDNPIWGNGKFKPVWTKSLYFESVENKTDRAKMKFRRLPDTTLVSRTVYFQPLPRHPWVRLTDIGN